MKGFFICFYIYQWTSRYWWTRWSTGWTCRGCSPETCPEGHSCCKLHHGNPCRSQAGAPHRWDSGLCARAARKKKGIPESKKKEKVLIHSTFSKKTKWASKCYIALPEQNPDQFRGTWLMFLLLQHETSKESVFDLSFTLALCWELPVRWGLPVHSFGPPLLTPRIPGLN